MSKTSGMFECWTGGQREQRGGSSLVKVFVYLSVGHKFEFLGS